MDPSARSPLSRRPCRLQGRGHQSVRSPCFQVAILGGDGGSLAAPRTCSDRQRKKEMATLRVPGSRARRVSRRPRTCPLQATTDRNRRVARTLPWAAAEHVAAEVPDAHHTLLRVVSRGVDARRNISLHVLPPLAWLLQLRRSERRAQAHLGDALRAYRRCRSEERRVGKEWRLR